MVSPRIYSRASSPTHYVQYGPDTRKTVGSTGAPTVAQRTGGGYHYESGTNVQYSEPVQFSPEWSKHNPRRNSPPRAKSSGRDDVASQRNNDMLQALKREIDKLKEENFNLGRKLEAAQRDTEEQVQHRETALRKLRESEEICKGLEQRCAQLTEALGNSKASEASLTEKLQDSHRECLNLQEDLDEAHVKAIKLGELHSKQANTLEEQCRVLKTSHGTLKKEAAEAFHGANDSCAEAVKKFSELNLHANNLDAENAELKAKCSKLEAKVTELEEKMTRQDRSGGDPSMEFLNNPSLLKDNAKCTDPEEPSVEQRAKPTCSFLPIESPAPVYDHGSTCPCAYCGMFMIPMKPATPPVQ
ncbi:hypothetical protein CYMTET_27558 [Cymbomonas tetramitiformis]|uniref:Uncharacterized protein n=1 Tax=Cymbomonas tetramitiformis TaxID=36881 RepID=A0AAE0FPZ9_9CHLO|nr:hypothetical protein CYMTET_27558 [Cymbomonas tetramitiformis]